MGQMSGSKSLFPIIEGIDENPKSLVHYSVCSNGLFMTKKVCGRGTVTVKVNGIKGLPEGPKEEVSINILPRKIPISYFWEFVNFFRYIAKNLPQKVEAYILLGYNFDEDEFCLYVPKHEVTGGSVKYDIESFWKDKPGYYCVMDVHAHTGFSAFWSKTDDEDDKRDRFSMVIGKQDNIIPEHKLRFSAGKRHIDFTLDDIFSNESESIFFDYREEIKNISIKKNITQGYVVGNNGNFSLYESMKYRIRNGLSSQGLMDSD